MDKGHTQTMLVGTASERRRLPMLSLALCMLLLLVGVQVGAAKTTVVHLSASHGVPFHDYLRERAESFEALHPDIDIVIEVATGNYTEGVQVRLATDVQVNVLDSTHSFMVFSIQNRLVDLRPHLEREGIDIAGSIPGFALDVLGHGNSILGIPSQIYQIGTIYNQTLLEEAGLQSLRDLGEEWSWAWLQNEARKLTRDTNGDGETDQFAVSFSNSFINMDPFVHQAGGMFYDRYLDPTESRFNTQDVHTGLEFVVNQYRSGFATNFNVENFFSNRGAAITLYGVPPYLTHMRDSIDNFEVATQPMGPVRRGGHTYFGPYHVLKSADSAQDQAAYSWVNFLALNSESQVGLMEATGRLPAYLPVLRDLNTHLSSYPEADRAFLVAFAQVATDPDNFPHYLTPAEPAISRAFNTSFPEVFEGKESLNNFLTFMHDQVQTELNR